MDIAVKIKRKSKVVLDSDLLDSSPGPKVS